ncbi:hypothetical protein [Photorhabdus heterorhabditis]|uniref:hypothetical protein n=1 Tax=Photorhabdus heterorhabditis TaxID=880156 RepID=UPI00156217EB|nr:hypothetical protein [Photorhabdus heterorhabditis]NRN27827.1 hypothetical protein [Photorhabdus heterorhabditis subsp. aluminescens]
MKNKKKRLKKCPGFLDRYIPDSEVTQQQHQQYQRQQAQQREIKQQMRALITGFVG